MLYLYKDIWNVHFLYFIVFIASIYPWVLLDVLRVFKDDDKWVIREAAIQMQAEQSWLDNREHCIN